ncbi:hypothetical protein SERLA73DRAFT_175206 [Serpula lacrymans var. lacrymans S7.3]|uniref:Sorbose reductase sou1 n=2 Tax=Serpula lacrymans var. lacrymans TaxID=341189 RepID=F8PL06_SERL3|nr:uncharacterized protein SERLADRAFT_457358 [Serpula lacrymans var. lacrymans S7.9]EGO03650.1 hypothetical protein SERLA73DRAFT_175206 [Serpula lacrymans var. lacrymans S7.3]EGO29516.1 hypothetical protein SERLADRAFT_457358 [Serpula lacrymans var. lacrymans S7.9]
MMSINDNEHILPVAPLDGVAAVLAHFSSKSTSSVPIRGERTIFSSFALASRVAVVTGGHRGIGLEIALALAEAGAIVYCLDTPSHPDDEWGVVKVHVDNLAPLGIGSGENLAKPSRLEYISADVTSQDKLSHVFRQIVEKEGRMDVCFACAGVHASIPALSYSADDFRKLIDVNVTGVFLTAQAAAQQMVNLGSPGSIVLIGSMSGSVANQGTTFVAYNTSKGAVLQMARSLAIELAPQKIRVNTISPGYILTKMTFASLEAKPSLAREWTSQNPMGRFGRPDELRGVATWLASDASTFCTGSDIIVDGGHTAW